MKQNPTLKAAHLITLVALSCIGIVLSLYYIHHYQAAIYGFSAEKSFCNISSLLDCDSLQYTPTAALLGIPIGAWSLLYFFTYLYLVGVFFRHPHPWEYWALQILGGLGLVIAIAKATLALGVYHKLCITCAGGWIILGALAVCTGCFIRRPSQSPQLDWRAIGKHVMLVAFMGVVSIIVVPNIMLANQEKTAIATVKHTIEQKLTETPRIFPEGILSFQHPDGDYVKGDPHAPVTIVTFHDYECPVCGRQSEVFRRLLVRFPKEVKFVIKNFPLDHHCNPNVTFLMHQTACYWAEVARCMGRRNPDVYWQFYDAYYRRAPKNSVSEIADQFPNLTLNDIQQCIDTHSEINRIQIDISHGQALYVVGTPTFFINGYRFEGYVPYYVLEQFIQRLLGKK